MAELNYDNRNPSNTSPVWYYQFPDYTLPNGGTSAVSQNLPVNGVIRQVHVTASAGSVTYTHTIKDASGRTIYAKAGITSGGTDTVSFDSDTEKYCPDGCTVEILPSGDPGADETVTVEYIGW